MPRLLQVVTVHQTFDAFLRPYAEHFRSLGWRVDLLAAGATACRDCTEATDMTFDAVWERRPVAAANAAQVRDLRRLVQANRYDLVHVHTPVAAFLTRFALRPSRATRRQLQHRPPIAYTAHGFHFDEHDRWRSLPFELLERRAGRWTDHLIVINDEDRAWAATHDVVPPGSLEQMPGIGLDLSHYVPDERLRARASVLRAQLGIRPGQPAFTMVAEFIPRKRHVDAVEALAQLGQRAAHLVLVGTGPLQDRVRQRSHELGIADRCHLVGQQRDVRPYMLAAQAVLLPSAREGLPRCVLEANSLGVPVIATDIRGTRALVDGGRGYPVPVAQPDRLAAAMAMTLDDPDEARVRARRARRHVAQFGIEHLLERHEHTYGRLLRQDTPLEVRR